MLAEPHPGVTLLQEALAGRAVGEELGLEGLERDGAVQYRVVCPVDLAHRALAEVGIERRDCYVTNSVKHFKFESRGKRRLHKRADADEQAACLPWLMGELALVQPEIVVCLGSMAATNLFGRGFRLLAQRGEWQPMAGGVRGFATFHPAYLLRLPDADARDAAYRDFVADLRQLRATD